MFEGCNRLMSLAPVSGPVSSGFTRDLVAVSPANLTTHALLSKSVCGGSKSLRPVASRGVWEAANGWQRT